jgi:hypothetical protein
MGNDYYWYNHMCDSSYHWAMNHWYIYKDVMIHKKELAIAVIEKMRWF